MKNEIDVSLAIQRPKKAGVVEKKIILTKANEIANEDEETNNVQLNFKVEKSSTVKSQTPKAQPITVTENKKVIARPQLKKKLTE